MTQAKHTPGPWELEQQPTWPWDLCVSWGDEVVITARRWAHSTSQKTVADVLAGKHMGKDREKAAAMNQRQLANLRLISAAPELLEALRGLLPQTFTGNPTQAELTAHWERERDLGNGMAPFVLAAYAAIAKAEGQS